MTAPARFWHRYAAWSLDAALIALVATPFVAGRVHAAAQAVDRDLLALLTGFYRQLDAALGDGAMLPAQALLALADDSTIRHGIATVQSDLLHLAWPPLLAFALLGAVYHVVCESSRRRASPGKRALGLQVERLDGAALSPGRAAARHAAAALSWLSLNIGHAMALAPPKRQALHDRVSHTRVVMDADRPLPTWARGWLAAQALAALVGTVALAAHWAGLMQTALEQALG